MGCGACLRPEASGAVQGRWLGAVLSGLCLLSALALLEWLGPPTETAWSAAQVREPKDYEVRAAGQHLRVNQWVHVCVCGGLWDCL